MLISDLFELIRNGENSGIEFKEDIINNKKLAKEIVAFANMSGGIVFLGIEDVTKRIVGITRSDSDLEQWIMNTCRDKIRPAIIPYYEVIKDVEPGKDVAVVRIERGITVHSVWHNNHNYYYIRVGTQSRIASTEELQRLFQQRGAVRTEIRPVSGSSIYDLDLRRIRDYFKRVREQEIPPSQPSIEWKQKYLLIAKEEDSENWEKIYKVKEEKWKKEAEAELQELLINTEILIEQEDTNPSVTVAGLLLFGKNPKRLLPQAGIDAVAYPGTERGYEARERLTAYGPMTALYGTEGVIENGIVEQTIEFIRRNTVIKEHLETGKRIKRQSYPDESIREAIVNALVHRDYMLSGSDIELSIFEDRIEIISPGKLPNTITIDRMKAGCRAARNQLLKDIMRDYGYMEHMGLGVPRKIIKLMREQNKTEPELIEDRDGEQFILYLKK